MGISYSPEYVLGVQLDKVRREHNKIPVGYMNAYHSELAYGGPEEGGWWFTVSEPISSIRFYDAKEAFEAFTLLEKTLKPRFDDDIPMSSTISHGDLRITVEDHIAEYEPRERPRYE